MALPWLLSRLFAALALALLGGGVGVLLGKLFDVSPMGAALCFALGNAAGLIGWLLLDELRAARLLRWIRSASDREAPRAAGLWGELAYRTERAVRGQERALALERQRLTQFLSGIEASPNGVLLLDADDQITWCSLVAADHLGLDAERDRHQPITNLVRVPEFVGYLKSRVWGDAIRFNLPGRPDVLSVTVRGYGDDHKLVLSQDISELLRNDLMRRDFVANVSHEIRTPLTVLAGFLETMDNLPLAEAERRRVQTLMRQQTTRMQLLVSDLLTLAQLEGSPRPQVDQWVPVGELMQRVLADAQSLSAGRHRLHLHGLDRSTLAGAETELQSALGNLLTNAVRYTPEGGRIDLSWQTHAEGAGELTVRDTGIGIAREHLPRLTERFYRIDGSRSRETGGTGLGLAIVKHVMQRHGGTLEISSAPGKGSCFSLRFPSGRVRPSVASISPLEKSASLEA